MSDNNISHDSTDCDELSIPSTDDVSDLVDALDGIGISRARALVMAGIDSVACLAACDPASIGKLPSFGDATAHDVVGQARARESVAESEPDTDSDDESDTDSDDDSDTDSDDESDTDSDDDSDTDSIEELVSAFELDAASESETESASEIDESSVAEDDSDVDANADADADTESESESESEPDSDVESVITDFQTDMAQWADADSDDPDESDDNASDTEIDVDVDADTDTDSDTDSEFTDTDTVTDSWSVGETDEDDDDTSDEQSDGDDEESDTSTPSTSGFDELSGESTLSTFGFDELSGDELQIAVVGHKQYGTEMFNKDAVDQVRNAIDASPIAFENITKIVHPDKNHGHAKIKGFVNEHNNQFDFEHTDQAEEKLIYTHRVNTPWTETDGVPEDEISEGVNGEEIWSDAPQARNLKMADIADALIIVDDGRDFGGRGYEPFLSDMKACFLATDQPIFNYSEYLDNFVMTSHSQDSDEVDIEYNGS